MFGAAHGRTIPILALTGCGYVRLLRPSVLRQLNPRVVVLVNEFPELDNPNEAILAQLPGHGGLARASVGGDGVMRAAVRVRLDQPGLYKFTCPVGNHGARGTHGLILARGDVPAEARLDRPAQRRPGRWGEAGTLVRNRRTVGGVAGVGSVGGQHDVE